MKGQPSYQPSMTDETVVIAKNAEGMEIPVDKFSGDLSRNCRFGWNKQYHADWMLALHACVQHIKPEVQKDESASFTNK